MNDSSGLDEHTAAGLLALLERDAGAGEAQLELLRDCLSLYEREDLLKDGRAEPLFRACADCRSCWSGDVPRPAPDKGEIAVPWIGPGYLESGICAVAINLNKYSPLGANWWIVRGHIYDRLGRGSRRNFEYRVGQYLAAIRKSQQGISVRSENLDPHAGAQGWLDCAFLEAVKCSPDRGVSRPTETMWANCPPRYLTDELAILKPRLILAIGVPVGRWIRELLTVRVSEESHGFVRGAGSVSGKPVEVICLNHPSFGHWRSSREGLLGSLASHPASPG